MLQWMISDAGPSSVTCAGFCRVHYNQQSDTDDTDLKSRCQRIDTMLGTMPTKRPHKANMAARCQQRGRRVGGSRIKAEKRAAPSGCKWTNYTFLAGLFELYYFLFRNFGFQSLGATITRGWPLHKYLRSIRTLVTISPLLRALP